MAKWLIYHVGYRNGLNGSYGVEPNGVEREHSTHRTKKEAMAACEELQSKAAAKANDIWYERGQLGYLMPLYTVEKKR